MFERVSPILVVCQSVLEFCSSVLDTKGALLVSHLKELFCYVFDPNFLLPSTSEKVADLKTKMYEGKLIKTCTRFGFQGNLLGSTQTEE